MGRVLLVSQEMTERQIQKRIHRLLSPEEAAAFEESVQIICKVPGLRLDTDDGAAAFRDLIAAHGADVVLLDALSDVRGAVAENDNDGMGDLVRRGRDLIAGPLNLCLFVLHHKGKMGEFGDRGARGASSIEDVPADVFYLDVKDGRRVWTFSKERDSEKLGALDLAIVSDAWPDGSRRVKIEVTRHDDREEKARRAADYVGEKKSVTAQDVERHFGWPRSTAGDALKRGIAKGWIETAAMKGGKTGTATLYGPAYTPEDEA
jgi:hypothetical protein